MVQPVVYPPRFIIYPDSDGQPMADNTKQFNWITRLKEGLEAVFDKDPNVFVAGNLLWYPVENSPDILNAPDVLVALSRPKGDRGSYRQWEEANQPPQVVIEILSPGNRFTEMQKKFSFYERYGADEYYLYDPQHNTLEGWERRDGAFDEIINVGQWTSPRLGIRFELTDDTLHVYRPDGQPFTTYAEMVDVAAEATRRAEQERQRAELLAQKLRALGVDPDAP